MTFALVTEGISEHKIIKHLLAKFFKDADPVINQVQPQLTENERNQQDFGGWMEVLNFCQLEEKLNEAFLYNEYLVIQIDTDVSELNPYNVPHLINGQAKSFEQLHSDIIDRLKQSMPQAILDKYGEKIIFAICIHTTECWLLPIYYADNKRCKTDNCLDTLNREIRKRRLSIGDDKNSANSKKAYETILKNIKKRQDIESYCIHNVGFQKFVEQLKVI